MNTYRRHLRRRARRMIRRNPPRKLRSIFKRRDPWKRSNKSANRQNRQLKRMSHFKIQRPLTSNLVFRKFTNFTYTNTNLTVWNTAPIGCQILDYILAHMIPEQDLIFYKNRYFFANLVTFTVTFFIQSTRGLVKLLDTGAPVTNFIAQQQVTDTRQYPLMFVGHFNSAITQSAYNTSPASVTAESDLMQNKTFGRLSHGNKVVRTYHTPEAYRSVFARTSNWTLSTAFDDAFAGPVDNEPHGCVWYLPDASNYPQGTNVYISMGMRIDSTIAFKDRRPNTRTG